MAKKASRRSGAVVHAGEVWAVPIREIGYMPMLIARASAPNAAVPFAFAYLRLAPSVRVPSPKHIPPVHTWEHAWIGLVPLRPFVNRRWKRVGQLPQFALEDWPIPPRGNYPSPSRASSSAEAMPLCSIETTRDEPTMTLIDNFGVPLEVAREFPRIQTLTQASSFESALFKHFAKRKPLFWDLVLEISEISSTRMKRWRAWSEETRARCANRVDPAITAGRSTDRNLKSGDWVGYPLAGGGFGVALVAARKNGIALFADAALYAFPKVFDFFPTLDEITSLRPDDAILFASTSMIVVRDGRWRVLGRQPNFSTSEWPVPATWHLDRDRREPGFICVKIGHDRFQDVQVDPETLALDPKSGDVLNLMMSPAAIELSVARAARGQEDRLAVSHRVTPIRIAAWRKINDAIAVAVSDV